MYSHFFLTTDHQVTTLTLNRPAKRNPMSLDMLRELEAIALALRDDPTSRIVILTGAGTAFSAGADISSLKHITDEEERRRLFVDERKHRIRLINRAFSAIEALEQITIAAINGYAIGGGWGLALACDFRLAVPGAQFWFPEVDLGAALSLGATARLTSMVGAARAKEIVLTCDRYSSEDLHAWGLVNRIVPADQLLPAAHALAQKLLAKPPQAVTGAKLTVNAIAGVAARESAKVDPDSFIHALDPTPPPS